MKTIITIGRQFGSGGKEIGIRVARELGIPFYDKELMKEAAKQSGLSEKNPGEFRRAP
jgi:cytidylate kinase